MKVSTQGKCSHTSQATRGSDLPPWTYYTVSTGLYIGCVSIQDLHPSKGPAILWSREESIHPLSAASCPPSSSLLLFFLRPGWLSSPSLSSSSAWSPAAELGPGMSSGMDAVMTGGQWKASVLTPDPWDKPGPSGSAEPPAVSVVSLLPISAS